MRRPWKLALGGTLAAALVIVPLSSASADWYYHGPYNNYGPPPGPLGLVGAVLGGAAIIATAPLAFFGAGPGYGYYGGQGYYGDAGYYGGGDYGGGDYNGGYYGGGDYNGDGYPDYGSPPPDNTPGYGPDEYGGGPNCGPCPGC